MITKARQFYNEAANLITTLAGRWLDEKDYEDIKSYQIPLNPIAVRCGITIERMTARPFGCLFSAEGKTYKLYVTASGSYGYKQTGVTAN